MSNVQNDELLELLRNGNVREVFESRLVADKFIGLYMVVNGIKNKEVAEAFYATEKFHFLKIIAGSENLSTCTKLSLYGVFLDVAVSGLSFDPSMKHVYVVPFNVNTGTKDNQVWEKRASLQISGYGELLLRQLQGQIKYTDNPILVYEGDDFSFGTKDGKPVLDHVAKFPRQSDTIIACYLRITRHDDSIDYKVFASEDIRKFQEFSKDKNSLAWNAGFPGMVQAKTIKHAFKAYPKIRVGAYTRLESDVVDAEHETVVDLSNIYGVPQQQLPEGTAMPFNMNFTASAAEPQPVATAPKQEAPLQQQPPAGVAGGDDLDF